MTACFRKHPRDHIKKEAQKVLSQDMIKDHAGNKNAFLRLSPFILESTPSCYHEDCSKCANNSVVCQDGVSDILRNYFMLLTFQKFHDLNINKNDKVLQKEILKLSVATVAQMVDWLIGWGLTAL